MKFDGSHNGIKTFTWIWFGQLVSLLGTGMTRFSLLIWAYQQTGSATTLALLGFFSYLPFILLSPLAGVLVDRMNRRWVMLFSDLYAALLTLLLLGLFSGGHLMIWHIYLVEALTGACEAFQIPACSAAISVLMPAQHYSRANSLFSMARDGARVFAPLLAGLLLSAFGLGFVMRFDLVTFSISLLTLLTTRIPNPARTVMGEVAAGRLRSEMTFGFHYIFQRPGLRSLMTVFLVINLLAALTYYSILPALILARSGGQQVILGAVQSALGVGGIVGGFLMAVWGGPKRRAWGVMLATALSFLFGDLLLAVGRSLTAWVSAAFLAAIFIPFISSGAQAIWQTSIPQDVQGRVFSVKEMLQTAVMPLGFLFGGLLADRVFEPAMRTGGGLVGAFHWLVGSGPGAGMALMFVCTATLGTLTGLAGLFSKNLRSLDTSEPETFFSLTEKPVTFPDECVSIPGQEYLPPASAYKEGVR
jgi:MFS transporter, DHA3 family, macrolide efflux protein